MTHSGSLKLFSVKGIDLRIHFSLIFLLFYVVFVASTQVPKSMPGSPLAWGLFLALGLFASVFIHELGHALTARAQGLEVRGITLMMLGGVSEFGEVSEEPYAEFKLAVIGPLVSILMGALFIWIHTRVASQELSFYTLWLGRANLVLGIFNLFPAFPLDGGRALRSVLAARMGMISGTTKAVAISNGLSWFLGILGLLYFNIILMLIAVFINLAARAELSMMRARKILKGLEAKDLMIAIDPIDERATLKEVAARMIALRQSVLPVQTAENRPALISLENLRIIKGELWSKVLVTEVMEVFPRAIEIHDQVPLILQEILTAPQHTLPVQGPEHRMIGIIRYADLSDVLQFKGLEEAA